MGSCWGRRTGTEERTLFVAPQSASEIFFFVLCFGSSLCHVPPLSSSLILGILCCNGHYLLCTLTSV